MDMDKFLLALPQFLILLPGAASCYLPTKNQMKYSPAKTAAFCMAAILPNSVVAALLCALFSMNVNTILLLSLVLFFFLYRRTVDLELSCSLAVYVGVCAVETFPVQLGYVFDAWLHPSSGAENFSPEAALFRLGVSALMLIAFAYPAVHYFQRVIDIPGFSKIWYFTVTLSSIFLILNVLAIPQSYSIFHTGRMLWIFPIFESGMFAMLVAVYILFYQGSVILLKHAELQERTRLFDMQSHQYRALQEHMRQTARLRHDFRHSVRLLASLAKKGDVDSIQAYLTEYETNLMERAPANYCANAALNALFGYYCEMAVSAKIRTDWHIELPEPLPFSEIDMAVLFGNLMENAIAGCQTAPEETRYFCLTTEICHENTLYIVSTNSFDGKVRKRKGGYRSTKHNGNGIGLSAIAVAAEKYGGLTKVSNSDTEFFVDVTLKM
ncbi:MAG: GHKL domain-containing protein [Lachnospiraceae bacterium]|nr:GHKL domain-containing protein [Lachnospiraceae bacterium]